jgi:transcriptional regulator with XRE-family HTH domain
MAGVFTVSGMSPSSPHQPPAPQVAAATRRLFVAVGIRLRDERLRRRWSLRELADRSAMSPAGVHAIEDGQAGSVDAYVRLATALGLRLQIELTEPRRRREPPRAQDPVHSAMGELEAAHLRRLGFPVGIDEPYQHYQFAGRADVIAWDTARRAFLHLENRTRFTDLQDAAGSFNAKRAYLGAAVAQRLGIRRWTSETHVLVGLWSADVLHVLRLRRESFRAMCPGSPDSFVAWWTGNPPDKGAASSFVVLDPSATQRQRRFMGLDEALTARPRYRGYADAAARLLDATNRR